MRTLPCLLLATALTACASPEPAVEVTVDDRIDPPPATAAISPPLTDASSASLALLTLVRNYELPPRSVDATPHRDAPVDNIIRQIQDFADAHGIIFDGRRAAQGLIVLGRPGDVDDVLIALAIYHSPARLGIQQLPTWAPADDDRGQAMHRALMTAIARIQP